MDEESALQKKETVKMQAPENKKARPLKYQIPNRKSDCLQFLFYKWKRANQFQLIKIDWRLVRVIEKENRETYSTTK